MRRLIGMNLSYHIDFIAHENSQDKTIVVPMINGLRVKDILKFAREKTDIDRFLPDYKANKLPDRAFL